MTDLETRDLLARLRSAESVRGSENFPVALRALPERRRRQLHALYAYARFVDDVGDEPLFGVGQGDRLAALDVVEAQLRDLYAGRPIAMAAIAGLGPVVAARRLPMDPFLRLLEANRVDQRTLRYETFDQLIDYCSLSANPVGELVLHMFTEPTPEQVALSDRVCTALQIIEHLQDVGQDRRRGRIYLPAEDLRRFDVAESDLDRPAAGRTLRALLAFEAERARARLEAGAPLVSTLRGWARLSVSAYIAGGRAALAALQRADYDSLSTAPKADARSVVGQWLAATVRSPG